MKRSVVTQIFDRCKRMGAVEFLQWLAENSGDLIEQERAQIAEAWREGNREGNREGGWRWRAMTRKTGSGITMKRLALRKEHDVLGHVCFAALKVVAVGRATFLFVVCRHFPGRIKYQVAPGKIEGNIHAIRKAYEGVFIAHQKHVSGALQSWRARFVTSKRIAFTYFVHSVGSKPARLSVFSERALSARARNIM